jgi:hypothetical protein
VGRPARQPGGSSGTAEAIPAYSCLRAGGADRCGRCALSTVLSTLADVSHFLRGRPSEVWAPPLIGLWVTALPRPLAEGLMRDEDPTGAQQRFAPAVAEAEAVCVQRAD